MTYKTFLIIAAFVIGLLMLLAATNPVDEGTDEVIRGSAISLSGVVVDATTREGIPQADVTLQEEGESTSTDEYGSFYFSDIEIGTHSVSVEAVNYRPAQERVEVTEEGASVEFQLDPEYE
ncbi:MAG: carboxypeptidase regulatory-like domain-containing protein [Balneolaceae bacterium]